MAIQVYPRFIFDLKSGFDVEFHNEKIKNNTNGNSRVPVCLVNNKFDNSIKNKKTKVVFIELAVVHLLNLEYQLDLICIFDLVVLSGIK